MIRAKARQDTRLPLIPSQTQHESNLDTFLSAVALVACILPSSLSSCISFADRRRFSLGHLDPQIRPHDVFSAQKVHAIILNRDVHPEK